MASFLKKAPAASLARSNAHGAHDPAMCAECPLYQSNTCNLLDPVERSAQKAATRPEVGMQTRIGMYLDPGTYRWCSCGCSLEQPFCDGSHKVTDCVPLKFKITEAQQVFLCGCKRTKTPPFCDGSHNDLA